jgi:hypothetical protein
MNMTAEADVATPKPNKDLTPDHATALVRQARINSVPIGAPVPYLRKLRQEVMSWLVVIEYNLALAQADLAKLRATRPGYCVQPGATDCDTCSLSNYGRDCQNNPVK